MTVLQTRPDDVDVVTDHDRDHGVGPSHHRAPLLVLEPLGRYLDAVGVPPGDLAWRRIGDGQANVTYEVRRGGDRFVLRRGPRPPFPPSAHDMLREARVVAAVGAAGAPVPRVRAVCDDTAVLGVPFYLVDLVEGDVLTTTLPPAYTAPGAPAATVHAAVDALADLHAIPLTGDVAALGRPAGYLERQVRRFTELWRVNTRREVPAVERVAGRLAATTPGTARSTVVHGDYRLGNLMFAAPGRLAAILDWEMATLGDPLADLGYLLATYSEPGGTPTVMDLTPVTTAPGFLTRDDLAARYAARTGADLAALGWYEALALWKAAVFCEAMYTRWLDGERPGDTFAPGLADGVPALADAAAAALDRTVGGAR